MIVEYLTFVRFSERTFVSDAIASFIDTRRTFDEKKVTCFHAAKRKESRVFESSKGKMKIRDAAPSRRGKWTAVDERNRIADFSREIIRKNSPVPRLEEEKAMEP